MLDIIQADVLALGEYTQAVYSMEFPVQLSGKNTRVRKSEMLWRKMIRTDIMLMNVPLWE